MTKKSHYVSLSCNSSCLMSDAQPAYSWYWNHRLYPDCQSRDMMSFFSQDFVVSCGLQGHEDLHSDEVCEYEPAVCLLLQLTQHGLALIQPARTYVSVSVNLCTK